MTDGRDGSLAHRRARDLVLAVTFVAMAGYEAAEMRALERTDGAALPLAVLMHALQVAVVLAATWTVLRAWREKSAHEEALARMVERVVFAQEEERRRVAYELHDGVAPLLVSARQHLEAGLAATDRVPSRADGDLTRSAERMRDALTELRHVLRALRPAAVDGVGLASALDASVREAAREAGWTVTLEVALPEVPLAPAVETAAYRIVQEALANAARHARSPSIEVAVRGEGPWLTVTVRDRGVGTSESSPRGLGLASMRERAALLGGRCEVTVDGGTTVRAWLPLKPAGEAP